MRKRLWIITISVILMLITLTVSAKPIIKKVDLDDPNLDNTVPVKVITESDIRLVEVKANDGSLDQKDSETWGKNLDIPLSTEVTIESKDLSETTYLKVYRGGCTANYGSHTKEYSFAHVEPVPNSGTEVTFYLTTRVGPSGTAIIGFCVYPDNPKNSLIAGPDAVTPDWTWVPKFNSRYRFGFGRLHGYDNIDLNADRYLNIGTAFYDQNTNSDRILMHILDSVECKSGEADDEDNNPNTCWRRPGTTQIPEFPTIALPIAAVIGLVFFFQHRRNKEE